MNEIVLNNGLKFFYKALPGTHSLSFDFFIKIGVRYESKHENGISNLLGNLHYRYINGYNQEQLFHKIESMGSNLQIFTYKDFMRISIKTHPNYYKECIDLLKSLFETFRWDKDIIQKEKKTILKQIEEESQYVDINKIAAKNYYGESALASSIKGDCSTINNLTVEQISDFKKCFFNKNGTAFFFSGPIEKFHVDYIKEILSDVFLFDNMFRSREIIPTNFGKRPQNLFWSFYEWDYIDVDISFDITINEKEFLYLDVLNCILGEGIGSKLQIILREKLSLIFDIKSFVEKYDVFNVLHIQYSVNKNDFIIVFKTVLNVLNEMKNKISDCEIASSLPFYKENLDFLLDEPQKYNFYYAYNTFILKHSLNIEQVVLPSDIITLAKKIFISNNIVVTCLGDDSRINKKKLQEMLFQLDEDNQGQSGDGSVIDTKNQ